MVGRHRFYFVFTPRELNVIGVIFEFDGVFKFFHFPFIVIIDCSSEDMLSESTSNIFSKFLSTRLSSNISAKGSG